MPKLPRSRTQNLFGDNWQQNIPAYDAQTVQSYIGQINADLEQLEQQDQEATRQDIQETTQTINRAKRSYRKFDLDNDDAAIQALALAKQGYAPVRIANLLGLPVEQINRIFSAAPELRIRERFATQAYESGSTITQIAAAMGVSEREAGLIYARGHNSRQPFPTDIFPQKSFISDANRQSQAIQQTLQTIEQKLKPYGYGSSLTFEPDPFGGRYTVQIVNSEGQSVGQPFRLTATPNDVPLISKTGKGPGGFRKTQVGLNADPLPFDQTVTRAVVQMINNARSEDQARNTQVNVVDLLNVDSRAINPTTGEKVTPEGAWRHINWEFMTMAKAGQHREERAEVMVRGKYGTLEYPDNLPYAPMVYQGTVYPIESRNLIPGNIRTIEGRQYTSQKSIGKAVKRDNFSLTRKFWEIGPQLGIAYPSQKQHILGQLATEAEEVTPAMTLVLTTGGLIPEGEMWLDRGFAPWAWRSFEQNPEKYQLRIGDRSEEEVLRSLGLWDEKEGMFKPRTLHPGQTLKMGGSDKPYDFIGKNERAEITGYEIGETLDEQGNARRILQLQGFYGSRTNSTSAFKFQEEKHLALAKRIRERLGLDVDIIKNKPSGAGAMINALSALPYEQLEALWQETHGHRDVVLRTETMADLKAVAKVYGRLFAQNYQERIPLVNQQMDLSTLMKYWRAGRIEDPTRIKTLAPFFEGSEPMFRTDVQAAGSFLPVGLKMVTDVTDLEEGGLSHDTLRHLDTTHPGLGTEMRRRGEPSRAIYDTLYEIARLNADPSFNEVATPIADIFNDLNDPEMRRQVKELQAEILVDSLPEYLAKAVMGQPRLSAKQAKIYQSYSQEARSKAIEAYYASRFGTELFAFYTGHKPYYQSKQTGNPMTAFMLNSKTTERFGFVDEETNQVSSKLARAGRGVLSQAWNYLELLDRGNPSKSERYDAMSQAVLDMMKFKDQEKLLLTKGSRKKWFGTSDKSIFTHVHASDPSIPRNAMATSWAKIGDMFGLDTRTETGRRLANEASRKGQLRAGGFRNPASDPIAQLQYVRNVITPDLAKELGLDLDLSNDALIFHPEAIMAQGGDNDSDMSQVFGITRFVNNRPVNLFELTAPGKVTEAAVGHSAGEYWDAVKKLNASEADTTQDILGFDPTRPAVDMLGRAFSEREWSQQTKEAHELKSVQIGQSFNYPLKGALNLSPHFEVQQLISQYGGSLYQNPLDAKVYEKGSPEADFFGFLTSWDPVLAQYRLPRPADPESDRPGWYYGNYRKESFQKKFGDSHSKVDAWQIFGAGEMLDILKTMFRPGKPNEIRAPISPEQAAAFMTSSLGSAEENQRGRAYLAGLLAQNPSAILSPKLVEKFAGGNSPLAQMVRGYGVHNALHAAGKFRRDTGFFLQELAAAQLAGQPFAYEAESTLRNKATAYANHFQNDMYDFGRGFGSAEFKQEWLKFLAGFGLRPTRQDNLFYLMSPHSERNPSGGQFLAWDYEKRGAFYQGLSNLASRFVTPEHPALAPVMADYQRLRDYMAPTADEGEWAPQNIEELAHSESVGDIVGEKWRNRHQNAARAINKSARKGQVTQQMLFDQEEAVKYMAEGGVLNRPTRIGQTRRGQDIVGGEAGKEFVVPERKTQDLGGGLKVFDEDELGSGAPHPFGYFQGSQGSQVMLAKGGILDYQAYGNVPTSSFEDAIRQVAYELSGGAFTGDVNAAKDVVRQKIEADIRQLAANAPQNGLPGLMASSLPGRATEMMALALGPNPATADFSMWNDLLAEYGLSADMQPLGVNPQQINPAIKKQLQQQAGGDPQAYKTALAGYMKDVNTQLAGKSFSHANYGNVYNSIPGWQAYWNGNRPASTIPAVALSEAAQGNLARLIGGAGGGGGNDGQPPQDAGEQGNRGAGGIRGKEITSYAQPFSPQAVEMYKTLAEKLSQYADTIEELNQNGATLAEVSGEAAQVIKAAGKTYHRLEGQYSRAQRVLRYDQLQGKFDEFQYREGDPLTEDESRELSQLQEQMTKPTGADVTAASQVKGYIQDIFPIYAERELAGRKGTRLPRQMIGNSPLAWAAQIAGRDPGLVKEARQTERQGLRLGQIDQRLGDIKAWYAAGTAGRLDAFKANPQPFEDASEVSFLSSRRQAAYEAAVPLKVKYDEAMRRGDLGTAQRLWDQIEPLNIEIGELKDQIGALTPHIKEHVETLGQQTATIREDLKERKQTYSALVAKEKELQNERISLVGTERTKKEADIAVVKDEMDTVKAEIKSQAGELGRLSFEKQTLTDLMHEPQGRAITGLGKRPQTYGQQAWNELAQGYAPQRLFWEFQNIQQMQYMAFMPMLQMRQQYLGEQAALGQANYALGAGTMPQSVLSAMAAQANMSRASSAFGQGVDNSITMGLWKGLTNFLGQNEGAGSFLGAAGFDLTSALTAAMGLKMVGGPAVSALGKLVPALGAGGWTAAGGLTSGSLGAAALGGGGLVAGGLGLGLGLGINEYLASQNVTGSVMGLDWAAEPLSKHLTVAAYESAGYTGDHWGGMFNPANSWVLRGLADQSGLASYMGWDVWNQEKAEAAGAAVGKYTGAVTDPLPVWVTKMETEVAKQLGVSQDQLPFDRAELAQMVQMAAEDQGLTKQQIESGAGIAEKLAQEIAESYTSGVSMSQRSGLRQKAIDVSGYAPGTEGARMMSEWVNQGSLFERQQRLQAAGLAQNFADAMNFTPQQRQEISQKVYDLLAGGMSLDKVGKLISAATTQRLMSNQYTWSAAAYKAGMPEMALMDQEQPWMPKNQSALWAIEDRRRAEDNARELGTVTLGANGFEWAGGRQETELGWQRQKLDLEQEFWDFRRKSQLDDFAMQQKLFDFNIRQQRMAMEWEEKQSHVQSAYYEKQYALNKKIFELQSEWQRQDFDKQESRLDIRRDWQLEDSAWNRESYNIQAGWQMEDLQRALRYASNGRERMDIRRQIERASIMNERRETEFDREDSRNTTQYNWAKEDLAENRRRFEEMNELQRQQMELGREYWQQQQAMAESYREARRASLEEQIALQQEQNALTVQQFNDGMALQDKQHALETQINETKYQWALDDLALARQRAAEDEKILGLQRETMSASYFYAFYQAMGYDAAKKAKPELEAMADAAGELADAMERYQTALSGAKSVWDQMPTPNNPAGPDYPGQSMNPNNMPDGPMSPAPPPPWMNGFAQGGYTGDGALGEVAGIVHRGEYVVPSSGALVLREGASGESASSAEVVMLLAAILAQLQEGGGTILIDTERLKKAGFLHQSNFSQVYR